VNVRSDVDYFVPMRAKSPYQSSAKLDALRDSLTLVSRNHVVGRPGPEVEVRFAGQNVPDIEIVDERLPHSRPGAEG
jgi:hypothetical protein